MDRFAVNFSKCQYDCMSSYLQKIEREELEFNEIVKVHRGSLTNERKTFIKSESPDENEEMHN